MFYFQAAKVKKILKIEIIQKKNISHCKAWGFKIFIVAEK